MKEAASSFLHSLRELLRRFQYPLLLLLVGLVLILLPGRGKQERTETTEEPVRVGERGAEEKLESILSEISGAGRVRVMLTVAEYEETVYEKNRRTESRGEGESVSGSTEEETVLYGASSAEKPLAVKVIAPKYKGALVIAEGAGLASVRLNLVNAVSSLTGLGTDKITVIKMCEK